MSEPASADEAIIAVRLQRWAIDHPAALILGIYCLLALLVIPIYPHFASPNEVTRWLLAAAVVDEGSLEVSSQLEIVGPRVEDLATFEGKVYSNKTPGATLAALPGYIFARVLAGPASARNLRFGMTLMRLCASTLPLLLVAAFLAMQLARCGADPKRQRFAAFVLLFCTPLFAYGLLLFSHTLAAAALFTAWGLLFLDGGSAKKIVGAGACIGIAVLAELPLAIPAAALVIGAFVRHRARGGLLLLAGGVPFALMLGAYNQAIFGDPFELASGHERFAQFRAMASTGLFGIGLPSIDGVGGLLFDLSKGLFVFSPLLLFAFVRVRTLDISRTARVTLILVPLVTLLVYGGYANWHGGWTVGPRYILAVVPFLVFMLGAGEVTRLEALLAGWSAAAVALTSLVFPFVPLHFPLPWGTFAMPILARGVIVPSLLHFVSGFLAVLVPLGLCLLAAATVRSRWWVVAGMAAAVLAGWVAMRSVQLEFRERISRGYITEVYLEQPGAIAAELPPGLPPPPRLLSRRDFELRFPPASWPF